MVCSQPCDVCSSEHMTPLFLGRGGAEASILASYPAATELPAYFHAGRNYAWVVWALLYVQPDNLHNGPQLTLEMLDSLLELGVPHCQALPLISWSSRELTPKERDPANSAAMSCLPTWPRCDIFTSEMLGHSDIPKPRRQVSHCYRTHPAELQPGQGPHVTCLDWVLLLLAPPKFSVDEKYNFVVSTVYHFTFRYIFGLLLNI